MLQRVATCFLAALIVNPVFAESLPFFQSDSPLAITFELPLDTLLREAKKKPEVDGVMRYTEPDGRKVSIALTMTTRGRSRLSYCKFPPLKMDLKKEQTKGTIFEGQNKLKLVTRCRTGKTFTRYVIQEFGIYKAYNEITDFSYRARWVSATYKDSEGKRDDQNHDGFFIESHKEAAQRLGRERIDSNKIPAENLDPIVANRNELFQYLIANTDWSMIKGPGEEGCCHNGKVFVEPGTTSGWVVIPYDFDQAGLIYTRYSAPNQALGIRTVRTRLYRGRCIYTGELDNTIALFNEKRGALEAHLAPESMSPRDQAKAKEYIAAFYNVVNNPAERSKRLENRCIGGQPG